LLIIIILFAPLSFYVFNFKFYTGLYEKNGVYETIDRSDAAVLTNSVVDFFKTGKDFQKFTLKNNLEYFNNDEINHLKDVKILLDKIFILFYSSILLILILTLFLLEKHSWAFLRNISSFFIIGSSLLIILLAILYILANNFSSLFEKFHFIFFPQGNWAFPEGALIITIFPFGFFYDFFAKIITTSLIIALIILITGIIVMVLSKRKLTRNNYKS
jgi:integral membrane protein (TIGR01906 family)